MIEKRQRPILVFVLCVLLICISAGLFFFSQKTRPRDFNVILIVVDALRADHLGCYGYPRDTSYNLDRFAREEAVIFTQAISQASHTEPVMGSLCTGTYPARHRMEKWGDVLSSALPKTAVILKDNGYATVLISEAFSSLLPGVELGYDFIDHEFPGKRVAIKTAVEYLKRLKDRKFFIFLHYMGVHFPYAYPPDNRFLKDGLYDPERRLPITPQGTVTLGHKSISSFVCRDGIDNPDFYIAEYDTGIAVFDDQLQLLLKAVKDSGLEDRTIIIITSDHGELMGEHDYYFDHGNFLYDPLIRVPLIIKYGNLARGKTVSRLVEASVDILPTILDMLGIKTSAHFDGSSLKPLILGYRSGRKGYAISDIGSRMAVRTEDWKLVSEWDARERRQDYKFYDLRRDPEELHSLDESGSRDFRRLKSLLDSYGELKASQPRKESIPLDKESRDALKSLGYLQ